MEKDFVHVVGWKLAMRVLQSDLYRQLDDAERAECDYLAGCNPMFPKNATPCQSADAAASQVNGGVPADYNEQHERNRHDAEDLEALHKCLDKHGIPRADAGGTVFSAWGRILRFVAPRPTDAEILESAKRTLYPVRPCDENIISFVRRLETRIDQEEAR